MRRIGRLPPDKGVEIARQLCAGLAAAHDKGVLHRDLKPANVMLDGRGRVRITDFGLARLTDELGGQGVQAGTPAYMAPEQAAGLDVREQSDLYSLGLLLYEVFTGKSATSLQGGSAPPTPSSIVPELDPSVERAILRCLEVEPGRRPASAAAVVAALPGSDPLLAALAAGETPSPEMVAAAGDRSGLPIRMAVACLTMVVVGLLLACVLAETTSPVNQVELKTPTLLREIARKWIAKHLTPDPSASYDEADGLILDQGPIRYWYRRRWNARLVPTHGLVQNWHSFGKVDLTSPPVEVPEEISIELDGTGRLLRFVRVPPSQFGDQVDSDGERLTIDWALWFPEELIGFRLQDLRKASRSRLPLPNRPYDNIRAWKRQGNETCPDQYVLAATFEGKPTHFEIGPWNPLPDKSEPPNFFGGLILMLLPIVAVLAWRNYQSGRIDRRTTTRAAALIFGLGIAVYVLSAHHQFGAAELVPLTLAFATTAFLAVYFGIWYSALEPLVRRIWPETLITWTRTFAGQFPDPLVGRDLLLGTVFGLLHLLIARLGLAVPIWAGVDDPIFAPLFTESLMGARGSLSSALQLLLQGFWICSFCLTLLALLRQLLRREILAILAIGVIDILGLVVFPHHDLPAPTWIPYAVSIGVAWSLNAFVIVRFGFLTFFVAWGTVVVLHLLPLTTNLTPPRLAGTLIAIGLVSTVAVLGFDMTLDGRPRRAALRWLRGG